MTTPTNTHSASGSQDDRPDILSTQPQSTSEHFPLENLPTEIKVMIFKLHFETCFASTSIARNTANTLALLYACKATSSAAQPILADIHLRNLEMSVYPPYFSGSPQEKVDRVLVGHPNIHSVKVSLMLPHDLNKGWKSYGLKMPYLKSMRCLKNLTLNLQPGDRWPWHAMESPAQAFESDAVESHSVEWGATEPDATKSTSAESKAAKSSSEQAVRLEDLASSMTSLENLKIVLSFFPPDTRDVDNEDEDSEDTDSIDVDRNCAMLEAICKPLLAVKSLQGFEVEDRIREDFRPTNIEALKDKLLEMSQVHGRDWVMVDDRKLGLKGLRMHARGS